MDKNEENKQDSTEKRVSEEQNVNKDNDMDSANDINEEVADTNGNEGETEISETDALVAEIAELKEKLEQAAKDKLLVMADFDNYRKRTLKEKADLIKSGGEECLKSLLPIIDDFERSIAAINNSSDVEALKEGVTHIYNKFNTYLNQHGIKPIKTENSDFNTEYHEAVTMFPVDDPDKKGTVIDCVQKGYTMNDKVIRFAKVVVGE